MTTMPTRVDGDLFDAAKSAGAVNSRSAAQQINHWARIGRAFEAAGSVSQREVERVLSGTGSYDALTDSEQALVRTAWDERISDRLAALDFAAEFTATGESWSEFDDGRVVVHGDETPA